MTDTQPRTTSRHLAAFLRADGENAETLSASSHVALAKGYARLAAREMADLLDRADMHALDIVPTALRFAEMHAAIALAERTGLSR